jgi:NAD/NADP transhydrogenase beta subunit
MKAIMTGAFMGLSVTAAGAAAVDYLSANNLLPACKAIVGSKGVIKSSNLQKAHDVGFCSATLSTLLSLGRAQMLDDQFGCMQVPPEVSPDQVAQIVVRYVEARPQRMQEPLIWLALEAIQEAWPCTPDFDSRFRGK